MRYNCILEIPEDFILDEVDPETGHYVHGDDLIETVSSLLSIWPASLAPGTEFKLGRKALHASFDTTSNDPEGLLLALFANFGLDWEILALQTFYNQPQFDIDGNEIDSAANKIVDNHTHLLTYLTSRPILDEDGNIIGAGPDADITWYSRYAGQADWEL